MQRRTFIKLCGGAAVLLGGRLERSWADGAEQKTFQRVSIVDAADQPLKANQLVASEGYIFHYPYQSTPALLLDLGRKVAGGVGPSGGVVAFTAICPHQFAYPTKSLSAFNYLSGHSATAGRTQAITCCLHGSAFDPVNAGAVLGGPAPRPLTMIELVENDVTGLSAIGTRGADIYPEFFKAFKRELRAQFGRNEYMQEVQGQARAIAAGDYSSQRVTC
jgi:Rieske Fe-S protein